MFLFILLLLFQVGCRSRSHCTDSIPSACANGPISQSSIYGFACPYLMMLTDPMIQAAELDHRNGSFVYVVGSSNRDDDCGKCYQVRVHDPDIVHDSFHYPLLIVQIVNSGYDVLPYQIDLFVGAGGFGYFTACNGDCQDTYCDGGKCHESMYDTPFFAWTSSSSLSCYSGGIHDVDGCDSLVSDVSIVKNKYLLDSCVRSNTMAMHQNFWDSELSRVQCPVHLWQLTGIRRLDDVDYPESQPFLDLEIKCHGDRSNGHYCITTMQDCCKMSCSWSNKLGDGLIDREFPCVYTCDKEGKVIMI